LIWNDLSVCTKNGTFLVKNCSGRIPNGHLCGLLGPSGAGKVGQTRTRFAKRTLCDVSTEMHKKNIPTASGNFSSFLTIISLFFQSTMLSALGGTLAASVVSSSHGSTASSTSINGLHMTGDICYVSEDSTATSNNNKMPTRFQHLDIQSGKVAWLPQKDHFFNMLTVQETLELAAFLELPHHSPTQRQRRISTIMDSLGLTKLQHRPIGEQESGLWHNGLSGGEKRRLSLAVELISSPKLFLGDEPTTGLVRQHNNNNKRQQMKS
jgi:ABC-type Mn2+/Zn2+ transport system ATPase subunit